MNESYWLFSSLVNPVFCICAKCGTPTREGERNYCPECGAKMIKKGDSHGKEKEKED